MKGLKDEIWKEWIEDQWLYKELFRIDKENRKKSIFCNWENLINVRGISRTESNPNIWGFVFDSTKIYGHFRLSRLILSKEKNIDTSFEIRLLN